ncbi:MAG: maleylacetoacetate isomerase [Gammaproteobacteria bacterium]|nr:maleylacetoacetate isomerase [Gammaproteobacteria bacterium]
MELYSYFRSSAAYRVRIALHLKGLDYRYRSVNLLQEEEASAEYLAVNPQGLVPALNHDDRLIVQSMAICEYLEEIHPNPPLLPREPLARAWVRGLAQTVACEIHPLNNTRVLKYLVSELGCSEQQKLDWYRHWVESGLEIFERMLAEQDWQGPCCHGNTPTLADVFLIPQLYNARRFDADLSRMPLITSIEAHCLSLEAFVQAGPQAQADATDP